MRITEQYTATEIEVERFWAKTAITSDPNRCWEWKAAKHPKTGYGYAQLNKKTILAHRAAFIIANGYVPPSCVLHSCDNRICVNPKHLKAGTYTENNREAVERNPNKTGERLWNAKLTENAARQIKLSLRNGVDAYTIAREHGVKPHVIYNIKNGQNWAWVQI